MITIRAKPGTTIALGREGENLAREIIFDVSRWQAEYGPGTVSLIAQRQGDTEPYPCAITVDGATVTWLITSADTAKKGYGRCELQYRVGDTLAKSEAWCTGTYDALGEPAPEPPPPYQGWVDQVLEAGQKAQEASVSPPRIGDNGNWHVWDFEAGKYVDTSVPATGGGATPYTLPAMTPTALGGAMADPAEESDTQPVRIGKDNKLYTAPGGGSPYKPDEYVTILHKTFEAAVASTDEWGGESYMYGYRHFWTVDTGGNAVYADGIYVRIHVPAQIDNIVSSGELDIRVGQRAVTSWMSWTTEEAKPYIGWPTFVPNTGKEMWAEQNFDLREQTLSGARIEGQTYKGNFNVANTARAVPFSYALGLNNIEYFSGVQVDLISGSLPAGTEIFIYARKYDASKIKNIPKWGAT